MVESRFTFKFSVVLMSVFFGIVLVVIVYRMLLNGINLGKMFEDEKGVRNYDVS